MVVALNSSFGAKRFLNIGCSIEEEKKKRDFLKGKTHGYMSELVRR
jgi:hypothetical protein